MTLESLACTLEASPTDALATALQAYLAQHPEQADELRRVLVEANERDYVGWDRAWELIASSSSSRASSERRGEADA